MKRSVFCFHLIVIILLLTGVSRQNVFSQTKPFTIGQILRAISTPALDKKVLTRRIINDVRKRKVDFPLTSENEALLRSEGANNELIEVIRQNSPPVRATSQTSDVSSRASGRVIKNSIGMEFVRIPAGSYMMGSPAGEAGRDDDEKQQRVTITYDFYIGKYEVTQAQWKKVMGNNPSGFSQCGEDCPVEKVSWDDVQKFIRKLKELDNDIYRLPSEAEWEYAARAGSTTAFAFGDSLISSQANFAGIFPYGKNLEKTVRVGSYPPNAWGIYDMHGNVMEWCESYYMNSPNTEHKESSSGSYRVVRGGSWAADGDRLLRSAKRDKYSQSDYYRYLGFRLVKMER